MFLSFVKFFNLALVSDVLIFSLCFGEAEGFSLCVFGCARFVWLWLVLVPFVVSLLVLLLCRFGLGLFRISLSLCVCSWIFAKFCFY